MALASISSISGKGFPDNPAPLEAEPTITITRELQTVRLAQLEGT
jgi:hypothetical protein